MSDKFEGTMSLEGLIEGQLPPFPDAREKVEKWARGFAGGAVAMSVQVDGSHFSAMPSNAPVRVKEVAKEGGEASNAVADSLSDLLRLFPPLERGQVFSTLRSIEYRHKLEVQTLYAVGPDGRAATRQQTVPCETVATEEPLSRKEMIKQGVFGLVVAVALLGISSFFVDYRGMWRRMTASVEPAEVAVDVGTFEPYFKVVVTGLDRRNGMLMLEVTRTGAYPREEGALDGLYATPPETMVPVVAGAATTTAPATASAPATGVGTASSPATGTGPAGTAPATGAATKAAKVPASLVRRRLAVESLARGAVVLEFRDKEGRLIGQAMLRVADLGQYDVLKTAVPAPVVEGRAVAPAQVEVVPG